MRILYVEPFEGGSHASFTQALTSHVKAEWTRLTLPGRHWKWRMRGSAAWAALQHADVLARDHDLLFASSYVPLAELLGLAPRLAARPSILYFHENQLEFPWSTGKPADRDLHYGFTQLVSALAATRCVFNSAYNRDSFLEAGRQMLARMPDAVPPQWIERIAAKSEVLGVPMLLPDAPPELAPREGPPTILWNHRWEHDKNPEGFLAALIELAARGVAFHVAVCGHRFRRESEVFERARVELGTRVIHWGTAETREQYEALLQRADLAVSTAHHEFFGLAMLEATHFGAYPLVPDRLAYRELFPEEHRYADHALVDRLQALCTSATPLRADRRALTDPHRADRLAERYANLFRNLAGS